MNGQLDGLAKGSANHPNQQNRVWAQHLADAALAQPQDSSQEDEALPTDVLVVVAELLAGDGNLKTLANLNITGRHIHEGTVPVLYETVIFANEKAVDSFVRNAKPTVWKYVKFLFVTGTDLALLRRHLPKQPQEDPPSLDDLLTTSFPRLTVFGSIDPTSPVPSRNHNRSLHLTLYKPFKLDDLLGPCIPNESQEDGVGITFFGTRFLRGAVTEGPNRIEPDLLGDIVALSVRPGAFILNDLAVGMDGWHATFSGIDFRLDIVEEVDQPGVVDTLRTVMDHLALYASKEMVEKKRDVQLKVKCTPRVLEKIIEMYEARPCFLNFEVDLTASVTEADMQRYLLAFGSAYQQHWSTHARHPVNGQIFLAIQAPAPALDPSWWREYNLANDSEAEHMWMQWHGDGHYGIDDNDFDEGHMENADANDDEPAGPVVRDTEPSGFALTLSQNLMCRDRHQDGELIWSRSYHVAAPPPAAPTNGHQGGSGP
ncbi:hypothetical protein QFC22_006189 [Naganishia vaughanmartiniae]|uniref:Uncharacterized protein n=1 Tax=Naganishia vaughanmartiniae TaxID=1424756 RepID=A0ACC2WM15_9TREE|nr:hypothetical protein QFC22_006189 [Naganishia vaughanmartiniae]